MNEAETRAELIDPALADAGWGVEDAVIRREYSITQGRIQVGGRRSAALKADYLLIYRGVKLATIEAKSNEKSYAEGVGQAKDYATRLDLEHTFATNGEQIYHINMKTGKEGLVDSYPTPKELWENKFAEANEWRDKFLSQPMNNNNGQWDPRYYQENAVRRVTEGIADGKERLLLTMATGTGKTAVAFEIAWKLFHTRWNLKRDGSRRPRILFLADLNLLADQAFNSFSAFPEDVLVRIRPDEISKTGKVPTNGSIFFTIFQTFMSGPDDTPYFGEYPNDYFDLVIVDECHRGGAKDESSWRDILEYFSPAVQLGLTATPKRRNNVDTYDYFGKPVYEYSLKEGINDGFLTPFRVKRIQTTIDDYVYSPDDKVIQGDIQTNKQYKEHDFNKIIEITEREAYRVKIFLEQAEQNQKTLVFCKTQLHAAIVRDLINQMKDSDDPGYCCRVTANDGSIGENDLRAFQDNEKTIPTILTTSQKLSTGVDARNVRNIVLMRPVNDMIEFKQIVGRGTRMYDGKDYFTIFDFVNIFDHFEDPEWDGPPDDPEVCGRCDAYPCTCDKLPKLKKDGEATPRPEKIKIELGAGRRIELDHTTQTSFWGTDGQPVSAADFLKQLFNALPEFFKSEQELRRIWADPVTRQSLLQKLEEAGFGIDTLKTLRNYVANPKSDIFDVLEFISFDVPPKTREERVEAARTAILAKLSPDQQSFIEFVLEQYIKDGVDMLSHTVIGELLTLKYGSHADAQAVLGTINEIRELFIDFQKPLYESLAV